MPTRRPPVTTTTTQALDAVARLRPCSAASRTLAAVGLLLVASAAVHLGVHLVDQRDWWATDAWRKAVTFPFAFGLATVAIGWVLDRLPARRVLAWLVVVGTAGPAVVESVAVTVQAWRGVPSHFNQATGFDALVWALMGQAILVQSLTATGLVVWAATAFRRGDRAARAAVVGGLVLLLVGAGVTGGGMIARGVAVVEATGAPGSTLVGSAGSLKVAHAVAIHGLELLLVALAAVEARGLAGSDRARVVRGLLAGLGVLFAGTAWQAAAGRALQSPSPASAVAAVGAVVVLVALVGAVRLPASGLVPGPRPPRRRSTAGVGASTSRD